MSAFDLAGWLRARRAEVDEALAARIRALSPETPPRLAEAMGYSLTAGGKRLRPALCLATFEACGGAPASRATALDFGVALELVHTYSLVHDDLPAMDDDDLRRGRPTCHRAFDEATAILAGDGLLTEAFDLLASGPGPARLPLVALLARAAGPRGMVGGQVLDLALEGRPAPSVADVERVHRMKTGALLAAAAEGGAIAALAPPDRVRASREYGEALGLAFQIADDVLDVVGDPQEMGKAGRGDEAKGKPTYPALLGLDRARELARRARDEALAALEPFSPRPQALEALEALATWAVERTH